MTPEEARSTLAPVPVKTVDATTTVGADTPEAVVCVGLASLTLEAKQTLARISVDLVRASSTVQTRITGAFVHVNLAEFSGESRRTLAAHWKGFVSKYARGSILARVSNARV